MSTYDQEPNRLQQKLFRNLIRRCGLFFTFFVLLSISMLFSKPAYATGISDCPSPYAANGVSPGDHYVMWLGGNTDGGLDVRCGLAKITSDGSGGYLSVAKSLNSYNYWNPPTGGAMTNLRNASVGDTAWPGTCYASDCTVSSALRRNLDRNQMPNNTTNILFKSNIWSLKIPAGFVPASNSVWTNPIATDIIYDAALEPAATFTSNPSGTAAKAQTITFTVSWSNFSSKPQWLYFYPTGRSTGSCLSGCNTYIPEFEAVPMGNMGTTASGSYSFTYTYNFGGTYTPTVIVSNDCSAFQINTSYDSCSLVRKTLSLTVGGVPDKDTTYNVALHFPSTGTDRAVNTPQSYSWRVDAANQCSGSTISTKKIYAGYPASANLTDPGISLSGTSGSGTYTFTHTAEELGGNFIPYIQVTCANGSGSTIYNGDTLYKSRAKSLIIVDTSFNSYWTGSWTAGGKSPDYDQTTGSGAYFNTDGIKYSKQQPVLMRFYYKTSFTPNKIVIYADKSQLASQTYTLTGAYITNSTLHFYTLYYSSSGQFTPMIEVRSSSYNASNPSTYRQIWLGGGQVQDYSQYLTITNDVWNAGIFTFSNDDGIFGLDPTTFAVSFGANASPILQDVASLLSKVLQGGLYVLNFAYNILKNSPILDSISHVVHPTNGSTVTFPNQLFGWTVAYRPSTTTYTVAYASPSSGSKQLEYILNALVAAFIIRYVVKAFA